MDDLINKSKAIKVLESKKKGFENCISKKEVQLNREWNKAVDECISELQNQPIAYDVDKVCEKLNEMSYVEERNPMDPFGDIDTKVVTLSTAKLIVKAGGIE